MTLWEALTAPILVWLTGFAAIIGSFAYGIWALVEDEWPTWRRWITGVGCFIAAYGAVALMIWAGSRI